MGGNKENAVDGKGDTKWSASSPTSIDHPHWLTVNLGASYNLSGLELTWKDANEVVKFLVEVSEDGNTWTPVADHSANDKAESQVNLDFEAEAVQYVKVTIPYYAGTDWWPGISELQIWGRKRCGTRQTSSIMIKSTCLL